MHITRHDSFDSLAARKATWNELARGVPFRAWEWLEAWWRYYGHGDDGQPLPDRDLLLLAVWNEQDQLVGITPWYRLTARSGTRLVRFLGDGEVCSEYPSVLCSPEDETSIAGALAQWLTAANECPRGSSADSWDRLELTPVDAADSTIAQLLLRLELRGNRVYRDDAASCWAIPLPATWDEYLKMAPKKFRNRLRQSDRTWLQSGQVKLHIAPQDCDAAAAFEILVDLHQRRWQSRGLPGCFASPAFTAFHREVWKGFAADGRAMICWLELDGKPLAADYILIGNDTIYGYQSGIDPEQLPMQPGQLMNMAALHQTIERGFKTYDLLRGDEPYKRHLSAKPRPMLTAQVVPRHTSARLRYAAWNAGRQVRGFAKRGWQAAKQWRQTQGVGIRESGGR